MSSFTPAPATADLGVFGLGVMGANLARNLARHGHAVAIFNRTLARTERLMERYGSEGEFVPAADLKDFVASLRTPRVAIIMVQAGAATEAVIEELAALMEPGGEVRHGGAWCEITAVAPGANGGVLLTLADGREVAAALLAQRRYRKDENR